MTFPAGNGEHATIPRRRVTQLQDGREFHGDREEVPRLQFCHGVTPCENSGYGGRLLRRRWKAFDSCRASETSCQLSSHDRAVTTLAG